MCRNKHHRSGCALLTAIVAGALLSGCTYDLPSFISDPETEASVEPAAAPASNGSDTIQTGSIKPADSTGSVMVVQVEHGDTLASIARRHGIGWHQLAAANHIGPPYAIAAGQTLVLPASRL